MKIFLFVLASLSLFLFSCESQSTRIIGVQPYIVYEDSGKSGVQGKQKESVQYLALFVHTDMMDSEKSIKIENKETGLCWENFNVKNAAEDFVYAFFSPKSGETFPKGEYKLTLTGRSGRNAESFFRLEYSDDNIVNWESAEKVAAFDDAMVLSCIEPNGSPVLERDWKALRRMQMTNDSRTIYLFPMEKKHN